MLAGLPVVATRVGSVAEAVSARETGLLVPPDDPGALAIALPSSSTTRGRERWLAFSPAEVAQAYQRLYEEVLSESSMRRR